ncbi:hypothetical protein HU200_066203 [Digitaria exilis]|uniref:Methyltransferase n=1 Tax=Digitaria exilis TaxID=1010633 RepID=A0A834ZYL8_9POAL|nr:hypothetical protein HU200_066203 [Digitaria exilis]
MKYSKEDKPERAPVAGAGSRRFRWRCSSSCSAPSPSTSAASTAPAAASSTPSSLLPPSSPSAPPPSPPTAPPPTSNLNPRPSPPSRSRSAPQTSKTTPPARTPSAGVATATTASASWSATAHPRRSAKNASSRRPRGTSLRSGGPRARTSAGTATSPTTGSTARNPTSTGSPRTATASASRRRHHVPQRRRRVRRPDAVPHPRDARRHGAHGARHGCGVASWGGDLLGRGILTVSLAPRDNHEAQVQFALERGIPAILGIISTQRLPFPSSSFDMAHCSRCLIPWTEFGGLYLLEIHRILRPGGFWVLSGPPINYEAQKADLDRLKKMLGAMCFKLYNMKGDIAVWQKSPDAGACYDKLTPITTPAKCDDSVDPDAAWVRAHALLRHGAQREVQEAGAQRHAEMAAAAHRRAGAHQRRAREQRGGLQAGRRQVEGQGQALQGAAAGARDRQDQERHGHEHGLWRIRGQPHQGPRLGHERRLLLRTQLPRRRLRQRPHRSQPRLV